MEIIEHKCGPTQKSTYYSESMKKLIKKKSTYKIISKNIGNKKTRKKNNTETPNGTHETLTQWCIPTPI